MDDRGRLPQAYGDPPFRADGSNLMAAVFHLVEPRDPRSRRLVGAVLDSLSSGAFVYRYEPGGEDGFGGREGAFVPVSWWAVAALAGVGRLDEAKARTDEMCRLLPRLLAEEVEPATGQGLGNVPLVWSHMEAARALYIVDAAIRRRRWGVVGLGVWRVGRFLSQRRARPAAGGS
jgi:GH15 family glucan-1,4-alpha-glucosidase